MEKTEVDHYAASCRESYPSGEERNQILIPFSI